MGVELEMPPRASITSTLLHQVDDGISNVQCDEHNMLG